MSTVRIELSDDDLKEAVTQWLYKKTQHGDWNITLSTKSTARDMRGLDADARGPHVFATRQA